MVDGILGLRRSCPIEIIQMSDGISSKINYRGVVEDLLVICQASKILNELTVTWGCIDPFRIFGVTGRGAMVDAVAKASQGRMVLNFAN